MLDKRLEHQEHVFQLEGYLIVYLKRLDRGLSNRDRTDERRAIWA